MTAIAKVQGIKEVVLVGYYDESVFRDFIKDCSREFPQFKVTYLREYQALGTAGGLYHFRDAILKGKPERFFVLNADVCCSFPLEAMLSLFEEKDAEAVILGTRSQTRLPPTSAASYPTLIPNASCITSRSPNPKSRTSSTAAFTSSPPKPSSPLSAQLSNAKPSVLE